MTLGEGGTLEVGEGGMTETGPFTDRPFAHDREVGASDDDQQPSIVVGGVTAVPPGQRMPGVLDQPGVVT
jgi:hypothetical protein